LLSKARPHQSAKEKTVNRRNSRLIHSLVAGLYAAIEVGQLWMKNVGQYWMEINNERFLRDTHVIQPQADSKMLLKQTRISDDLVKIWKIFAFKAITSHP
jgi:hypothetical protein